MSRLDDVRSKIEQVDYVVLAIVEMLRGADEFATAISVGAHIGGDTPPADVEALMRKHVELGLLEWHPVVRTAQLTDLAEQLLLEDLGNWDPARRERARREREMIARIARSN
jgi:hypothetical protein